MKTYISGRISGLPEILYNGYFTNAYYKLCFKYKATKVYNPLEIKPLFGIKKYWFYMASDLYTLIFKCDSIYLIDNWKQSKGARIEVFFALLFKKKFL